MQKNLFNSQNFQRPISIKGFKKDNLKKILKLMIYIRKTEQMIALKKKERLIVGPVHLSVGQEAIAVGVSQNLKKSDKVFGNHRSHSHLLSLNQNAHKLFAEVLGKKTGFSKGMGGSMHLMDMKNGFFGSTPIVAGTIPLAVGAAISSKIKNTKNIAVSYLGDGAVEEGVFHESLNLAKITKAPILFVIENNLFASHMHISIRQPKNNTSRFATSNNIPYNLIDGNDVIKVTKVSKKLIDKIRTRSGPAILELITFRWYGHVDWREDVDVGVFRSTKVIKNWKKRDPVQRLSQSMIKSKFWSIKEEDHLKKRIDNELSKSWVQATNDPYPAKNSILKFVYHNG